MRPEPAQVGHMPATGTVGTLGIIGVQVGVDSGSITLDALAVSSTRGAIGSHDGGILYGNAARLSLNVIHAHRF